MKPSMTRAIYGLLAAELAVVVVFSLVYRSLDHYIYWLGGHVLTDGMSLYRDKLAAHWFTNTPFMAALFVPMTALPLVVARLLWQCASVAAFAWACAEILRMSGRRATRAEVTVAVALGFLLEPIWHSLFLGQVNLFILALVMTDIRRVSWGRRRTGWGIGIAAAVKLTPAIFVILLLAAGRVRAAVTATVAFAACTGLAFAIAPDASRVYWLHTFYDTSRVGAGYISNQSPYGAAVRILGGTDHVGSWFQLVPLGAGVLGSMVAAAWARRGDWLTAAAITGATGLLVSPISWAHHWVWVVPALAVLVRNGGRGAALFGYLLFVLAVPWWTPHDNGPWEYGFHGPLTLLANAYPVAALAFLVHMAVRLAAEVHTPAGISQGASGSTCPVSSRDLRLASTAGQPRETDA